MGWESRAAIFLKAADLVAGPYRYEFNAVTMIGQSKNAYQSEIDAVCELIDFFRFNAKNMMEVYAMQPNSSPGVWNRMVWRPLEGFVFAAHAVQLYLYRGQPTQRSSHHGEHRGVETV